MAKMDSCNIIHFLWTAPHILLLPGNLVLLGAMNFIMASKYILLPSSSMVTMEKWQTQVPSRNRVQQLWGYAALTRSRWLELFGDSFAVVGWGSVGCMALTTLSYGPGGCSVGGARLPLTGHGSPP